MNNNNATETLEFSGFGMIGDSIMAPPLQIGRRSLLAPHDKKPLPSLTITNLEADCEKDQGSWFENDLSVIVCRKTFVETRKFLKSLPSRDEKLKVKIELGAEGIEVISLSINGQSIFSPA